MTGIMYLHILQLWLMSQWQEYHGSLFYQHDGTPHILSGTYMSTFTHNYFIVQFGKFSMMNASSAMVPMLTEFHTIGFSIVPLCKKTCISQSRCCIIKLNCENKSFVLSTSLIASCRPEKHLSKYCRLHDL